jgi:Flp pilus assembly protein TadB
MYYGTASELDHNLDVNTRVGDADREATAERLRHHHAEGRISMDEFQERLDRCYRAKTSGELRELVADLPEDPQRAARHLDRRPLIALVAILVTIVAVSAVSDHGPPLFLFLFPLFFLTRFFLFRRYRWNRRGWGWRAGRQV